MARAFVFLVVVQLRELPNLNDASSLFCVLHAAGRINGGYTKQRGPAAHRRAAYFPWLRTVCGLMRHLPDNGRRSDRKKKEQ